MRRLLAAAGLLLAAGLWIGLWTDLAQAQEDPFVWGIEVEEFEYRVNDDLDFLAWDFDAIVGNDDLRFVWRSEAELEINEGSFETLENQARVQKPISNFFDAVAGIRVDTPSGPTRVFGVLGVHGLAEQFFEVDADFFISDNPVARLEVEYEGLITNRITIVPSIEFNLPFTEDEANGVGAFGPELELGLRLGYDLVDRLFSPYIGVHYERVFGDSRDLARAEGESADEVFFVVGARVIF